MYAEVLACRKIFVRGRRGLEKYFTKGIRMCSVLADVLQKDNVKGIATNLNKPVVFSG